MAVKYVREGMADSERASRKHLHRPLRKTPAELKGRLRLIYLVVGVFTVMLYVAYAMGILVPQEWGGERTGIGRIVAKSTILVAEDDERPTIEIELLRDNARAAKPLSEVVIVDTATAATLAEGDEIEMTYRISRDGTRLRVEMIDP